MLLEALAALPVIYVIKCLISRDPEPVNGVYAVAGKWYFLKRAVSVCIYQYRRWKSKAGLLKNSSCTGHGVHGSANMDKMDFPQSLQNCPSALDMVYFNGFSSDGTSLYLRMVRRHGRCAEVWLFLQIPGLGDFQYPLQSDTVVYNTDGKTFSAGGLKCEVVEPLVKWRLTFNGLLRRGQCNNYSEDNGEMVHVRFSFLWKAFTEIFNFDNDIPQHVMCDSIAKEKWSRQFFSDLKQHHKIDTHYEQGGEISGTLQIEGEGDKILHMRGVRERLCGTRDWHSFHRYINNFIWLEDGRVLSVGVLCKPGLLSHLPVGFMVTPCAVNHPLTWTDMDLSVLGENDNPPDDYDINFEAGGKVFHMHVHAHTTSKYYHQEEEEGHVVYEKLCHYDIDGAKGFGICEFFYRSGKKNPASLTKSLSLLSEPELTSSDLIPLVVPFTKSSCGSSLLVGGKGCQLALLTTVQNQYGFHVAPGFCVTITAFKLQLSKNPALAESIKTLASVASGMAPGSLQSSCQDTVQHFQNTPLCDAVQKAVAEELIKLFKGKHLETYFAVRSSAAGEDSEEMSAAGQMDTLLGVNGLSNIFDAIVKCWSSQFAFQAVEYRRQHGQPIDSLMGVVIQQMVPSEASGVLFTRDPLTGNPSHMTINCNYGLGESVVSGAAEPDTIIIKRSWSDEVSVHEKQIGKKKIQMAVAASGGCETTLVSEKDAQTCCMSDEVTLKLAKLGIIIEKLFSDPRDIEWAVVGKEIYLLQARPITSFDVESEWELMHEFDMSVNTDRMWLTTANIGEMMPGAVTPLAHSVFIDALEQTITGIPVVAGVLDHVPRGIQKSVGTFCNHTFISLSALGLVYENNILGNDKRVAELSILGKTLNDLTMEHIIEYTGKKSFVQRLMSAVKSHMVRYKSFDKTAEWGKMLETYSISEQPSALEQYKEITKNFPNYYQCWLDTAINTTRSGVFATVLIMTLAEGKYEWTADHYADVAMMLSNCPDVYSADIPTALQELAHNISQSNELDDFLSKTPENAAAWLLSDDSGDSGISFTRFLNLHGHRCIREAEFREKSWNTQPEKVVKVVQSMLKNHRDVQLSKKEAYSPSQAIEKLKLPVTYFGRLVMKNVLPRARAAVGHREWGKSISIKMADIFKTAYWQMADKMVAEGRLPDRDLLFFFTHSEIGSLLKTRSPRLISKAVRRRKILAKQSEVDYPEINVGYPKCLETEDTDDYVITSVKMSGMPVSNGLVRGTVRVVTSLESCDEIQAGDILVVHYTDVGWTPYFPLISGLVTEMGGLLSHGAVVAREYGIPCVVNMQRATVMFKTGDQVILNATSGTMEKIE